MRRNKLVYLDSEITKSLYTTGNEYMTVSYVEYIGYYHMYDDGLVLTLVDYDENASERLLPFLKDANVLTYKKLTHINTAIAPIISYVVPTNKEYTAGSFSRYFIRQRNDSLSTSIKEIDVNQYTLYKSKIIDNSLYSVVKINWKITGELFDTTNNNFVNMGVISYNNSEIKKGNLVLQGLDLKLKNLKEFYR